MEAFTLDPPAHSAFSRVATGVDRELRQALDLAGDMSKYVVCIIERQIRHIIRMVFSVFVVSGDTKRVCSCHTLGAWLAALLLASC